MLREATVKSFVSPASDGILTNLDIMASDENEVLQLNGLKPLPPNLQKLTLRGRLEQQGMILGAAAAARVQITHCIQYIYLGPSW